VFEKIKWTRVVLDEMQEVRSSGTKVAMACRALDAQFRFMVSGTPLYTGIADLHGELSFLRVYPWAQDDKVIFVCAFFFICDFSWFLLIMCLRF
jgi:E3 ubiquitin-protein ligase SHPRH